MKRQAVEDLGNKAKIQAAEEDGFTTESDTISIGTDDSDFEVNMEAVEGKIREITAAIRHAVNEKMKTDPEMETFSEENDLITIYIEMDLGAEEKKALCRMLAGVDYLDFLECWDDNVEFNFVYMLEHDELMISVDLYTKASDKGVGEHASDNNPVLKELSGYLKDLHDKFMIFEDARKSQAPSAAAAVAALSAVSAMVGDSGKEPSTHAQVPSFVGMVIDTQGRQLQLS